LSKVVPFGPKSLYVHVPFCARKCEYCAFYSGPAGGELIDRYVSALVEEFRLVCDKFRLQPRTIFFGGGTPSLLTCKQWESILAAMQRFGLLGAEEWTVECNPSTVSTDKARLWLDAGVNRVSMGLQSLDDDVLERLGRVHNRETALRSFSALREAGFKNINVDLMFGVPGQTLRSWRETLREVLQLGSEHLASYELIYEEDTPLFEQLQAGRFTVDEDLVCAMYEELVESVAHARFLQYEVANFARGALIQPFPERPILPAHACRHNVNYWRGGEFVGLGPSASSYIAGVRWKNCSDTRRYCEDLLEGRRWPTRESDQLPDFGRAGETAAFGLRMTAGWEFTEFMSVTGYDLRLEWAEDINRLVAQGWGERTPEGFRLTCSGMRFADAAAQMFLRP
jgi:oxygen-independent coproporphyrinogen-3 oxidase